MNSCEDNFYTTFSSVPFMQDFYEEQARKSKWQRCRVDALEVEPLNRVSALYGNMAEFATDVTMEAVKDTADQLGLAIRIDGKCYPVRTTAYKSLLDRAKINGTALPKLPRDVLAMVLNACLHLYPSEALLLIRDEKISAVHSGDQADYSILPIDQLLKILMKKLDERFPGNVFEFGYCDHSISSASWALLGQREDLIGAYAKLLEAQGKTKFASKLMPGIRFLTSDTGVASAKVSAYLGGTQHPIHIGECIAVDHRHEKTVHDFEMILDQLFAQFGNAVQKLERLMDIELEHPVNAMTRICKKLSLPKKAAVEAISMYEMSYGGSTATAHDVFMALQEIPFILKIQNTSESKLLAVEENMARVLSLNWSEYDLAKAVDY